MDYNDNDFQSQNFHLGIEENTKFPPALRSYALPKFDLDEHLQVHLRFNSLVDTEVLLGIQNQENNWIEDFSRGNSGLDFSSNAAESCSISRHNNVWSEATSSESVEMLLKSVGQDGAIAKQTLNEDSGACDGLDSLNNQMDPTLNQDDSIPSKIGDTIDTDSTLPPNKCPQRLLNMSKDSAGHYHHVEDVPLTGKDDESGYENLIYSDLSSVDKKFDSYVNVTAEQCSSLPMAALSYVEKLSKDDHSSAASEVARGNLDSVAFEGMQGGLSASSTQNLLVGPTNGCSEIVSCEKPEGFIEGGSQNSKSQILRQDGQTDDRHCAGHAVESGTELLKPGSLVQITTSREAVFSEKPGELLSTDTHQMDCRVLITDSDMGDQTAGCMPKEASSVATEGGKGRGNLDCVAFENMQVVPSDTSMQNLVVGATFGCGEVFICDKPEGLTEDVSQKGKSQIFRQDAQTFDRLCAGPAVEGGTANLDNFHSSVLKQGSLVHIAVPHEAVFSEKLGELLETDTHQMDCRILSKDSEMGDQTAGSMPQAASSVATEGDRDLEGHYIEKGNDHIENLSQPMVKMDFPVQMTGIGNVARYKKPDDLLNDDGHQVESGVSRDDTESDVQFTERRLGTLSSIMEENIECELVEKSNNDVGDHYNSVAKVCSPTNIIHEKQDHQVERRVSREDTESDVQSAERRLGTLSSVLKEKIECELVEKSNNNVGNLSSSVAKVCSPTNIIDAKQELADIKAGLNNFVAIAVTSHDPESALMKRKMVDKIVENGSSNQDVTSHVSRDHNSIGGISAEVHISYSQDAKLSQTCDNSSLDIGSGNDHLVHSDDPILQKESSTHLGNMGIEIGDLVIEKRAEASSHGQSTTSDNAEVYGSSAQHSNVDVSVPSGASDVILQDVIQLAPLKKLDQTSLASDEVIEHKEGEKPPSSVLNFIHPDYEETVGGLSTQFCSSVLRESCESHAVSGSIPVSETGAEMLAETTTQSTTAENSIDIRQASIDITAAQECVPSEVSSRDVTQFASFKKLDQTRVVAYEVVEQKEDGKPPLSLLNCIHLDKEETVNTISTQLCSSVVKENCESHAVSDSIPVLDSGQHTVCSAAAEMVAETITQSTAVENNLDIPKASIIITAAQECGNELKTQSGVHDSIMNQKSPEVPRVSFDKCEAASLYITGKTTSNGEILIQTIPSSLDGSSDDVVQNNQQCSEANLVSGGDSGGLVLRAAREDDILNHCEESSLKPIILSENIAQFHGPRDGSGNLNSSEPNCGSPTVISCGEPSQGEKEYQDCTESGSSGQNIPISHDAHQIDRKADTVNFTDHDTKENGASENRSFTFVVGSQSLEVLPERENGKGWKPFSSIQGLESPQIAKESPTAPRPCQTDPETLQDTPHGRHQVSDDRKLYGTGKGTGGDKTRLVSGSAAEKKTVATGRKRAKETSHKKTTEKDGSPCCALVNSDGTTSRFMQAEEITQYSSKKGNGTKACCVPTVQTSSLPDLNMIASPTTMFHQPFTDLQQVQLRAQIFVYGSLIQGTAPDEACMISAFGDTSRDGGRSLWEKVWRVAAERFNNQKLPLNNLETTPHSRSGARVSRCSPLQSVALSSPASRSVSKSAPLAILNASVSLSSPVWKLSTPRDGLPSSSMPRSSLLDSHQSLSPLHPYHVGNNTPRSQVPGIGPWVFSPQMSTLDTGKRYSALPIVEAVKVTSVRDLSTPCASSAQLVSPSPLAPTGDPAKVPTSAGLVIEEKRSTPGKHASADQKPRKRKRSLVSKERGQIYSFTPLQNEPVSTGVAKYSTTSECILSPSPPASVGTSGGLALTSSPIAASMHYQIVGTGDTDQRVIFSEETCSRIEQAKLHAEDAAALADSAVRHSQTIWNLLAVKKNSGLLSEVEAKLASASVAAALAASVAKAAAAAAKVASDAALHAKLMADEALISPRTGYCAQDSGLGLPDGGKYLGRISPASLTKGKDKTKSFSSMIVAAREAVRGRVEATSAATKRAENLAAVVKAAELAAEAVSQAGTVITMGDPIPLTLTELVESGLEGYWKVHQNSREHPVKGNGVHVSEQSITVGAGEGLDNTVKHLKELPLSKKETQRITDDCKINSTKDLLLDPVDNQIELVNSLQKGFGIQKGHKMYDLAKTVGIVPESEDALRAHSLPAENDEDERHQLLRTSQEVDIKEGSLVEVVSDEDGLRGVWFSADVLSLKDGKAYVCYTDLLQDEGRGQLKEWIPLESKGDKAPRIRIAHPMTAMKFEGTRKRRRAAMENYVWSIGDRVDAWMRDGWWEGIVTEKSNSDETKLTIHFPADGDSSIIRAWNLRPSLIWKDGQWMEWSRKNCFSHEVDTPEEKRQKLGGHEIQLENPCIEDSREPEESMLLTKKNVTVGKSVREENISDSLKMKRTGLQMEGSRVVFGIPKPGKKRKFMDVSKHYIADGVANTSEGTDSVKIAKYLVPQGSVGWKNISKVDIKGKRPTNSKPKFLNYGKDRSIPSRSVSAKDGSSTPVVSASSGSTGQDPSLKVMASVYHEENYLEKSSQLEVGSLSNALKAAEGPVLVSSLQLDSDVQSFKKASFPDKIEGGIKGKLAVAGKKLARDGENSQRGSSIPGINHDAIEPRRSNRRIQPTSRLLEGLQSSFIISKIPTLLHGKGAKTQHRSASSSRGNNHG